MKSELLEWLQLKLDGAEQSLASRLEMAKVWRGGSDKSWAAVGCRKTKKERIKDSAMHMRISARLNNDVEMFKALLAIVQQNPD